ncbi:hypothetical protein C7974DRAFT_415853 [Boeremia exigua]|uniref:uncharacterized protein n=1 Tax=Boeremia exigua TaxID=749465 RepID=UPI001E8EC3D3|nr:uncharacterized protein C7974DRAFT_415853 [Boeremia exigua]KAH6618479.1 hypothetical protein C7974DRAFT_415853 [Boeremia exigua]
MSAPASPSSSPNLTPEYIAFTNAHVLLAQAGSVFAIAALVVILRIYVRLRMVRSFGNDDWTMVLAMLLATGTFVCYVLEVPLGLGKHIAVIRMDMDRYRELLKVRLVHMICVTVGQCIVKISVGLFLLRLVVRRLHTWFLYSVIVFLMAFTVVSFCTLGNIINILTDFLLALLPVPLIWQLQLNLRTKISLILVLSLGLFACVAGIMKVRLNKTILSDPNRFIYDGYSMWNFIELDVGIIAGSLPAIKPLFNRFLDAARGLTSGREKSSVSGGRNVSGYQKHAQQSDRDIALVDYRNAPSPSVRISAHAPTSAEKVVWRMEGASSSEDSILIHHDLNSTPNAILVTKDVHIS